MGLKGAWAGDDSAAESQTAGALKAGAYPLVKPGALRGNSDSDRTITAAKSAASNSHLSTHTAAQEADGSNEDSSSSSASSSLHDAARRNPPANPPQHRLTSSGIPRTPQLHSSSHSAASNASTPSSRPHTRLTSCTEAEDGFARPCTGPPPLGASHDSTGPDFSRQPTASAAVEQYNDTSRQYTVKTPDSSSAASTPRHSAGGYQPGAYSMARAPPRGSNNDGRSWQHRSPSDLAQLVGVRPSQVCPLCSSPALLYVHVTSPINRLCADWLYC